MSHFLEPHDVERLTGYVMASKQLKWCRTNAVPAYLSARGEVLIPVAAFEGRKADNDAAWAPDFTPFQKRA